jgi:hypothetical protein
MVRSSGYEHSSVSMELRNEIKKRRKNLYICCVVINKYMYECLKMRKLNDAVMGFFVVCFFSSIKKMDNLDKGRMYCVCVYTCVHTHNTTTVKNR